MLSRKLVFWEVDVQADFMLRGGKLYVPGAEKLLPNIRRLTDAAREGRVFLVSHGCYHTPDDPEFATFPPHCVKGTPGARLVPEALTERVITVPNEASASLPEDLFRLSANSAGEADARHFQERARRRIGGTSGPGCRICRVWRGDGILCWLRSQGLAPARAARFRGSGCNRDFESRRRKPDHIGAGIFGGRFHHYWAGTGTA